MSKYNIARVHTGTLTVERYEIDSTDSFQEANAQGQRIARSINLTRESRGSSNPCPARLVSIEHK